MIKSNRVIELINEFTKLWNIFDKQPDIIRHSQATDIGKNIFDIDTKFSCSQTNINKPNVDITIDTELTTYLNP